MGAVLDHGITYFDTANNYGRGRSEQIVGAFLAPVRDEVVISTKVYAPFGPRSADRGLSADAARRATEISLRRLGTDRIDLLLLHRPDPDVPAEETAGAFAELVTEGKDLQIGTSTFRNHQLDALQQAPPAVLYNQAPYRACSNTLSRGARQPKGCSPASTPIPRLQDGYCAGPSQTSPASAQAPCARRRARNWAHAVDAGAASSSHTSNEGPSPGTSATPSGLSRRGTCP